MRNWFHRTLNIIGTNFRACSASGKMWTVFTCTIHAEHTRNEFYRTLSIRGSNFIAWWAYSEPISSHAEHARKCIEYDFQKSRVTGPWDHKVSVSAKKEKKISCLCTFKGLVSLSSFVYGVRDGLLYPKMWKNSTSNFPHMKYSSSFI